MALRSLVKLALIIVVLIAVATVAAKSDVFLILDVADGTVLCAANEVYVLVDTRHLGHRVSYLRFPWFLLKNYLGGIEDPDDDLDSLAVIEVTPSKVERHTVTFEGRIPGSAPTDYTPRKGRLYLYYQALGGLSFWAGDHIEPARQEERQSYRGFTEKDFDAGWTKRTFGVAPGSASSTFSIPIGDSLDLLVNSHTTLFGSGTVSIEILRPGKSPEVVWDHATHWGIVGRTEYQSVFHEEARRNRSVGR